MEPAPGDDLQAAVRLVPVLQLRRGAKVLVKEPEMAR
jgi:hypothetical protein